MLANIEGKASSELIQQSLEGLSKLSHRGTVAADGKSSDGCGILFKIDQKSLLNLISDQDINPPKNFTVAVLYLSPDHEKYEESLNFFKGELEKKDIKIFHIREVPIRPEYCGYRALKDLPKIVQVFVDLDSLNEKTEKK